MSDNNLELSRRKILGSVGAVGAAGAAAGLGTSALFSDEESFTNNSITAGTLDMTVDARVPDGAINDEWAGAVGFDGYNPNTADGPPGVGVTLGDMKPGDWVLLCYEIEVQDNPACLGLKTENTANDENTVIEPEADSETSFGNTANTSPTDTDIDGDGELAQSLSVTVYDDFDDTVAINGDLSNAESALSNELLGGVTLQDVWDTFDSGDAIADETNSFDFYVLLELPVETGNEVQSDSVEWDFVFDAVQSRNTDDDPYGNACTPVWDDGGDGTTCECTTPEWSPGDSTETEFANLLSVGPDPSSGYPNIDARVRPFNSDDEVITSLGADDFRINETIPGEGPCAQTIDSVDFESGGQLDLVVVFDDTGSMGDEIDALKNGVSSLVNDINGAGIDARYALVSFKDEVELDQDFTDASTFTATGGPVDSLSATGGGDGEENNLDALAVGTGNAAADSGSPASLSPFRSGAQRVVLDITDATGTPEDSDGFDADVENSQSDVEGFLNDGNFTYIAVSPNTSLGNGVEKKDIADNVNDGTHFELDTSGAGGTNFDNILTTITSNLTEPAYTLSYTTTCGRTDSSTRTVDTEVDVSGIGVDYEQGSYTAPGS